MQTLLPVSFEGFQKRFVFVWASAWMCLVIPRGGTSFRLCDVLMQPKTARAESTAEPRL